MNEKTMKLFISFVDEDEAFGKLLETHLDPLVQQQIIAPWHRQKTIAGQRRATEVARHLAEAQIILMLISPDFLASAYCQSIEVSRVVERHQQGKIHIIPILLRPTVLEGTLFAEMQALPLNGKPLSQWNDKDDACVQIVDSIRGVIADIQSDTASQTLSETLWTIPYERNTLFTGREDVLFNLHQSLRAGGTTALTQPQAISGLGGIGKTQTAIEYAYRYQNDYEAVLWIKADSYETFQSDLLTLAHSLQLPLQYKQDSLQLIPVVKRWLQFHTGWLLIIDNVDDLTMLQGLLPVRGKGHILLTTRSQITGTIAEGVELHCMENKEGALFLLHRSKYLATKAPLAAASSADRTIAIEIVQLMGGLPLALDQAGAFIEETKCDLKDYLHLFQTRQAELLQRRGMFTADHPNAVTTTWSLSFENVQKTNPDAIKLLYLCAFLDPDLIQEDIFTKSKDLSHADKKLLFPDKLVLNEAIKVLLTYSLIQRNRDHTFTIHRLVQVILKQGMTKKTQSLWARRAIHAVYLAFPKLNYKNWQQCQQYLPQVQACMGLIDQWNFSFLEARSLLFRVGKYLSESAQYEQAESLYLRALAIEEKVLGSEHPDTAKTVHTLAHLYEKRGKFELAEQFHQRTLDIEEKVLGLEHPDTAGSFHCMAGLYQRQGKYEQAESLYLRALAIKEKVLGSEHTKTATTVHALAHLYEKRGKFELAERFHQRTLDIEEKVLGPEHPDTVGSFYCMAGLYQTQGKYEQAESLYQRVLDTEEKVLGSEHPSTAHTLHALAHLYEKQGKYEQVESLYLSALAIKEKFLGSEHPSTASTLHAMAHFYEQQARYDLAESFHQRELSINEKVLGPEHPETAESFYCMAGLYRKQEKYEQAESLYLRALTIEEKVLGPEHPSTASTLHALAHLYEQQARYGLAESFHQRELAIREKVLGPEHPDTAGSFYCIARLYQRQGKYEQAESLYLGALDIEEKVLGPEHPSTATTRLALAHLYVEQGKYEQALKYEQTVQVNSENIAWNNYGLALSHIGRYAEAMKSYHKELAAAPDNHYTLYNIAVVMMRWKGLAEAQVSIDAAHAALLNLQDSEGFQGSALYGLGGIKALQGEETQALEYLQQAIALEKSAIEWAHSDIAWLELRSDSRFQELIAEST